MKWISAMLLLLILLPVSTSCISKRKQPDTGLVENKLRPCPSSPNCVCSEDTNPASAVLPVLFTGDPDTAWAKAVATVEKMGGRVMRKDQGYLHATFTSKVFRFVDDMELRLDPRNSAIHFRSASRIGYSDLGVNRKRAENFRRLFFTEQ